MKNNRLTVIDNIRGFTLINMIIYHLLWDLVYIYNFNISWYSKTPGNVWQVCICSTFIILSGFCFNLGKRRLKRALYIIGTSILVSLVTFVFMPDNKILFGILWFMGTTMLLMIPLDKILYKVNPYIGIICSFILFMLCRDVSIGKISFFKWDIISLPRIIYANEFTAYLGFPNDSFSSADYFPLIPWIWLYLVGYYIYLICKKHDLIKYLSSFDLKILGWLGRHTLIIYVLHQVVIYGILSIVFKFI